jgi:glycosyltransferase involved in cell wall biosynthesis
LRFLVINCNFTVTVVSEKKFAALQAYSRIWMDITTSQRTGSRINGTTRVEQNLARALAAPLGDRLRFCRYSSSRFVPATPVDEHRDVPTGNVLAARATRGPGASNSRSDRLDRRLERAIRHSLRSTLGKLQKRLARDQFAAASDGDCMFLAGETWSTRYDYDILRALRRGRNMKIAALCQDLIPITDPQFFESAEFVERYHRYVDFLLRDTDLVIAISQSTATELEKLKKAAGLATRIEIIQLGSDFTPLASSRPPRSALHLDGRHFALSVSTLQSRKNFDLLYRVWKRFAQEKRDNYPSLVIVGQRGFGSDDLLWQILRDPSVRDRVFVLHSVSDGELAWLYQNCCFTLYPSFAEGWGLPISESLAYGKICIAANTTSMPEASQSLCIQLDPIDAMGWHNTIASLVERPNTIKDYEDRIAARYRPRTWAETAMDVAGLLSTLGTSEAQPATTN